MVHKKMLIALGHICLEDYYVDVLEEFEVGKFSESEELFNEFSEGQKITFFKWMNKQKDLALTVSLMLKKFDVMEYKLLRLIA